MTARSFNGWLVIDEYPPDEHTFTAPGGKTVYCNSREVAVLLEYWARRWHHEVEPIAPSDPANWSRPRERRGTKPDGTWDAVGIHSWRPPGTKVGTGDQSNHRSATAVDINGHLHPYEATVPPGTYSDGFTQAQRDKVREIAHAPKDDAGRRVGRSGLDFARGKRDGMHLEVGPGVTRKSVQQAAKRLENHVGRSSTAPVWWINAHGHDVTSVQTDLAQLGYDVGAPDGQAGAKTDAAIRALQRDHNLTVDGRVGPQTLATIALALVGEALPPITEEAELMAAKDEIIAALTAEIQKTPAAVWAYRNPGYSPNRDTHGLIRDLGVAAARIEAGQVDADELAQLMLPIIIDAVRESATGVDAEAIIDALARRLGGAA